MMPPHCASGQRGGRSSMFDVDLVLGPTGVAVHAAHPLRVAVDLGDRPLAGATMEVVDVLRDDVPHEAERLEFGEGVVGVVGLARAERGRKVIGVGALLETAQPPRLRVDAELLELVHRRLAADSPEAVLASERGDAGLLRDAGARQRDRVPRVHEHRRGLIDELRVDRGLHSPILPAGIRGATVMMGAASPRSGRRPTMEA